MVTDVKKKPAKQEAEYVRVFFPLICLIGILMFRFGRVALMNANLTLRQWKGLFEAGYKIWMLYPPDMRDGLADWPGLSLSEDYKEEFFMLDSGLQNLEPILRRKFSASEMSLQDYIHLNARKSEDGDLPSFKAWHLFEIMGQGVLFTEKGEMYMYKWVRNAWHPTHKF